MVLSQMQNFPEDERDVKDAKKIYEDLLTQNQNLECVWSKKQIKQELLNVDHVIPFAIWKNNDLWNLLPARRDINSKKKDKVPSLEQLTKSSDAIIYYWEKLRDRYKIRFDRERCFSLIAEDISTANWQSESFQKLKEKCSYLIDVRGFEEWNL